MKKKFPFTPIEYDGTPKTQPDGHTGVVLIEFKDKNTWYVYGEHPLVPASYIGRGIFVLWVGQPGSEVEKDRLRTLSIGDKWCEMPCSFDWAEEDEDQ